MKRTPLKPRSAKRAALYRAKRVPLVRELLAEHPVCQRCHAAPSVDVHELRSRGRGGSITEPSNLTCVCRDCHTEITDNPAMALAAGWTRNSWDAA